MERASWAPWLRVGALCAFGGLALVVAHLLTDEVGRPVDAAAPCEDYFGPASLDGPACPSFDQNVVQVLPGRRGTFMVLCRCPRDAGSVPIRP